MYSNVIYLVVYNKAAIRKTPFTLTWFLLLYKDAMYFNKQIAPKKNKNIEINIIFIDQYYNLMIQVE